jgi:hypothetical protein
MRGFIRSLERAHDNRAEAFGLNEADQENDDCLHNERELGSDSVGQDCGGERLNENRPDQGIKKEETSTRQRCATEHDRENCVEFKVETDRVGIRRFDIGSGDQAGPRAEKATGPIS